MEAKKRSFFRYENLQAMDLIIQDLERLILEGEAKKKLDELTDIFAMVKREFDISYKRYGEEHWEVDKSYARPFFPEAPPEKRVGKRRRTK